uniref:RxLR effector protein n=1 Tax=Phytophthora brassicae TaxID=187813 RepID=A0A2L0WUF5_PHYBB|nr:RxLR29 effector [Phytophthora brassicae]
MHLGYLVFVATASLVVSSEAAFVNSDAAGNALVSSDKAYTRFLRSAIATTEDSNKDEEEERAGTVAGGVIRDPAETKVWLNSLLEEGKSVEAVMAILGMNAQNAQNGWHQNWNAFNRYQRMKWEKDNNKKMPYAEFGRPNILIRTKEETKDNFLGWAMAGRSVENVRKFLGVSKFPAEQQHLHVNWRAFKAYEKFFQRHNDDMQKMYDDTQYAKFGGYDRSKADTTQAMLKWVVEGKSVDEIAEILKLDKLSGDALMNHQNYPAFQMYQHFSKEEHKRRVQSGYYNK